MIGVERESLQHVPRNSKRAAATRHVRHMSGCIEAGDCGYAHSLAVAEVGFTSTMRVRQHGKGRDMSKSVVRRVGVIGLGKMGHPMARHLRKAGFDVTAYDIDALACSEAQRSGIAIAANPAAVAQTSDFVIIVVGC